MEPRAGQASYSVDRRAAKISEAGCDSFAVAGAGRRRSEGVHTWGSRHLFKGGIVGGLWSGPKWRGAKAVIKKFRKKNFSTAVLSATGTMLVKALLFDAHGTMV